MGGRRGGRGGKGRAARRRVSREMAGVHAGGDEESVAGASRSRSKSREVGVCVKRKGRGENVTRGRG